MRYSLIFLLVVLASCSSNEDKEETNEKDVNFFEEELGLNSDSPVLDIYCQFSECGEWGGHEEYMSVSKKDKEHFQLSYEKFQVNCDSMIKSHDGIGFVVRPKQEIIE